MPTLLTLNLVRGLIPTLIKEGLSASKAQKLLSAEGLGVRRTVFLNMWREFTGIPKAKNAWKFTPKKFHLPEDAFNVMTKNIKGEREYIFNALIKDQTTDEVWQTKYSFVSNERLSRAQAEEQMWGVMQNKIQTEEKYEETELVDLWFDSAIRRKKPTR